MTTSLLLPRVSQANVLSYVAGLDSMATYYWRIDVISGEGTHPGRVWMFRVARLAFPGAEGYG